MRWGEQNEWFITEEGKRVVDFLHTPILKIKTLLTPKRTVFRQTPPISETEAKTENPSLGNVPQNASDSQTNPTNWINKAFPHLVHSIDRGVSSSSSSSSSTLYKVRICTRGKEGLPAGENECSLCHRIVKGQGRALPFRIAVKDGFVIKYWCRGCTPAPYLKQRANYINSLKTKKEVGKNETLRRQGN
jgi:hypothetical protein